MAYLQTLALSNVAILRCVKSGGPNQYEFFEMDVLIAVIALVASRCRPVCARRARTSNCFCIRRLTVGRAITATIPAGVTAH